MEPAIANEPWYHGTISRQASEDRLMACKSGAFLFRKSESRVGLSLSVRVDDKVKHYMVQQKPNGMYNVMGKDKEFESVHHLVKFYSSEPLSHTDGQLLKGPCTVAPAGGAKPDNPYVDLLNSEVDEKALEEVREMSKLATLKASAKSRGSSAAGSAPGSAGPKKHAYESVELKK